ncbi:HpcH/HpaI aldolase family protein [Paracoccus laeviglucosivorans]|uniref:2-keto-3-deoxy-L-rhamnonate aldolase RhmA n=1 Tax=Paracoccus laeviglucosivorans TaxID=1197861 RepID=A0A521FEC0_9RHOB|nr:aldolase/citrate lyase family protein [Paracoccus laeviglucosivorans]SMO94475.1 2-keto-3-deoxy-L-rhamnonate aldolase RhmA [Paracoccus laeviglucosivorans]
MTTDFRSRLKAGELLIGTFVKTPSMHVIEILGYAGLDFAVVDQEHGPISIAQMDALALAARATGLPLLSRRWGKMTDWIAPLLDLGLTGVMVPHVLNRAGADEVADAVRFARGKRGISPSPRAGNYGGFGLADYRAKCDRETVAMVQIEDASALNELSDIAACRDIDMLFVGPADLSQSMGVGFPSAELNRAIERVIDAGRQAGVPVGLFVSDASQVASWHAKGVTLFVCGSDQSMLRKSASQMMAATRT